MAEMRPTERVRALAREARAEAAALAADWASRDAAAWDAPSACRGWAVRDVAGHLAQGAERAPVVVRHALEGTPPPDLSPEDRAARFRVMRALSGPELAERFPRDIDTVFRLLESADDAALQTMVTVPAGPHTLVQFATQRLSEAALHHWDIRAPRDAAATLRPEAAALLVDYLLGRMARMVDPDRARGLDVTYHCALDGPGGGPVSLTLRDGAASATRGAPAAAAATLTLPVETWIRLVWGRLDLAAALDSGRARFSGLRTEALALQDLFPGH
ncbi:MAG TPA: maleylpyruvate isomerase family mycothiol-dependent enzyme [Chloroflexota bacterium]|nr:maleylpyruvate isomerase family mycothiol-dependent enzyme [Chloroflexota bacterium]